MTCTAWRALAAGLCWLGLATAHIARAEEGGVQPELTISTEVTLGINTLPADGKHHQEQHVTGPSSLVYAQTGSLRPPTGSALAYAYAGYGVLGAYSAGTVRTDPLPQISGPTISHTNGSALAQFQDLLTVDGGKLNGTHGTLVVPWVLSGAGASASLTGPTPRPDQGGDAEWQLELGSYLRNGTFLGMTQASGTYITSDDPTLQQYYSSHTLAGEATVIDHHGWGTGLPVLWQQVPIVFGQPILITASLYTTFTAYAGNGDIDPNDPTYNQLRTAQAVSDVGHTLRWGGVTQVLDANGNPLTSWTLSAASGTDYGVMNTSAVPEPSSWLLMAVGLLAVGLRRQRGSAMR